MNKTGEALETRNEIVRRIRTYLLRLKLQDEIKILALQSHIFQLAQQDHSADPDSSLAECAFRRMRTIVSRELKNELGMFPLTDTEEFWDLILSYQLLKTTPRTGAEAAVGNKPSTRQLPTCPSLKMSSMTPRPIDYGPLLEFEHQGRTRWLPILQVILFWAFVNLAGYWMLSWYFYER